MTTSSKRQNKGSKPTAADLLNDPQGQDYAQAARFIAKVMSALGKANLPRSELNFLAEHPELLAQLHAVVRGEAVIVPKSEVLPQLKLVKPISRPYVFEAINKAKALRHCDSFLFARFHEHPELVPDEWRGLIAIFVKADYGDRDSHGDADWYAAIDCTDEVPKFTDVCSSALLLGCHRLVVED